MRKLLIPILFLIASCHSQEKYNDRANQIIDSIFKVNIQIKMRAKEIKESIPSFFKGLNKNKEGIFLFDDAYIIYLINKGDTINANKCIEINHLKYIEFTHDIEFNQLLSKISDKTKRDELADKYHIRVSVANSETYK